MPAQALILSRDEKVSAVFRRVFNSAGITLRSSSLPGETLSLLATNKYDAVIINCADFRDGYDILMALRNGRSNKTAVAFAITSGKTSVKMAHDSGATFVVEKPITDERVARTLRVAYGLILRERRRYFRHPLDLPLYAMFKGEQRENEARILNVSEGGLAMALGALQKIDGSLRFRFSLPQSTATIAGSADVMWKKDPGQMGIKFVQVPPNSRAEMEAWLAQRMNESTVFPPLPYKK